MDHRIHISGSDASGIARAPGSVETNAGVPCFVDFEASSLAARSYPIEVAWTNRHGRIVSHVISPAGIDEWTDWSPSAERIHGLSRRDLLQQGLAPADVAARLAQDLDGRVIFTDSPQFDGFWLARLFSAAGRSLPGVVIDHIDSLVCEALGVAPQALDPAVMARLKARARLQIQGQHRAALDVAYLMRVWLNALESVRAVG